MRDIGARYWTLVDRLSSHSRIAVKINRSENLMYYWLELFYCQQPIETILLVGQHNFRPTRDDSKTTQFDENSIELI